MSAYRILPRAAVAAVLVALLGCLLETGTVRAEDLAGSTVRVAAIQFVSRWARPDENRKELAALVRQAAGGGAKIVVLPETAISSYMSHDIRLTWQVGGRAVSDELTGHSPAAVAETVPGPSTEQFAALARELGIYLTVPILEGDPPTDRYFNTVVLVGPDGKQLLHYRKLNPWPFAERGWATRGDRGRAVVDTPYGRLGVLICYDINFEPAAMEKEGIDHLLYSIAWVDDPGSDWFEKRLPAVAREHHFSIIGANWSVPDTAGWAGWGMTRIIAADGRILARVPSDLGSAIVYADLPIPRRSK